MFDLRPPDAASVEAVGRYRAALLAGASPAELERLAATLDPALAQVLQMVTVARHEQRSPDREFADRLEAQLVTAARRSPGVAFPATAPLRPSLPRRTVAATPTPWSALARWLPQTPGYLATVGLVLVIIVAGLAMSRFGHLGARVSPGTAPVIVPARTYAPGTLEFLWDSSGGPDEFRRAYGMVIDPQDRLWVADAGAQRITILGSDGSALETWGGPGSDNGEFNFVGTYVADGSPRADIALDAQGNSYVTDAGNFRVQKFAPDHTFLRDWGHKGTGDGEFLAPSSIAVDASGTVYVSDALRNDIQLFDADGRFLGLLSTADPLSTPTGIVVDDIGTIWVANYGSDRIARFSSTGERLASWGVTGSGPGELVDPSDVAVDQAGRVFVVDQNNRRLQVFTEDGHLLAAVGGFGGGPGLFNLPAAVAVDATGAVYVSDRRNVEAFRAIFPP